MRTWRKLIAWALLVGLIAGLCGCGGKPKGMSDEMYDTAVYIVKAVDSYLDGESSLEETKDKVDAITIPDYGEIDSIDSFVNIRIIGIEADLLGLEVGTATISDLKESRDELADKINY